MPEENPFAELDEAARVNLGASFVPEYERYKAELIADGSEVDDIKMTLRGWIWDQIELHEHDDEDGA